MKRILLLAGLATLFTAGTASAQTSVQMSFGFGVPRPYISGDVFIGRSFIRPVYRPYYYYYPDRYPYYFYDPLPRWYGPPHRVIIYERDHRFFRRDFDRDREWQRQERLLPRWDKTSAHGNHAGFSCRSRRRNQAARAR